MLQSAISVFSHSDKCIPCHARPFVQDKFFLHIEMLKSTYGAGPNDAPYIATTSAHIKQEQHFYKMHVLILIAFIYIHILLSTHSIYYCLLSYYYVQEQKLPRCVVPLVMDDYQAGEMTIISDDNTYFSATYSIAPRRDGRIEINGWSQVPRDCTFKIGD